MSKSSANAFKARLCQLRHTPNLWYVIECVCTYLTKIFLHVCSSQRLVYKFIVSMCVVIRFDIKLLLTSHKGLGNALSFLFCVVVGEALVLVPWRSDRIQQCVHLGLGVFSQKTFNYFFNLDACYKIFFQFFIWFILGKVPWATVYMEEYVYCIVWIGCSAMSVSYIWSLMCLCLRITHTYTIKYDCIYPTTPPLTWHPCNFMSFLISLKSS